MPSPAGTKNRIAAFRRFSRFEPHKQPVPTGRRRMNASDASTCATNVPPTPFPNSRLRSPAPREVHPPAWAAGGRS